MTRKRYKNRGNKEFEEKVVRISRVSKKTKGGNTIGFSAVVVVGDKKGQVGVASGKATDVVSAIRKGVKKAKKKMIKVPMDGTTVPFEMTAKFSAGKVLIKPAPKGTGVIAGGPVRSVVEAAGYRDISAKIMGSDNQATNVYTAFKVLKKLARIVKVRGIELRSIADIEAEEKKKVEKLQQQAKKKSKKKTTKTEVKVKKSEKKVNKQKSKKEVEKQIKFKKKTKNNKSKVKASSKKKTSKSK